MKSVRRGGNPEIKPGSHRILPKEPENIPSFTIPKTTYIIKSYRLKSALFAVSSVAEDGGGGTGPCDGSPARRVLLQPFTMRGPGRAILLLALQSSFNLNITLTRHQLEGRRDPTMKLDCILTYE